jgi:hypothetical protein
MYADVDHVAFELVQSGISHRGPDMSLDIRLLVF